MREIAKGHKGTGPEWNRGTVRITYALLTCAVLVIAGSGCEGMRFAPNEKQKQNAWLHNRTALAAAQTAKVQAASGELQDLTELSELQSRAFTTYFGLPKELPAAETTDDILAESSRQLAKDAIADSAARPDPWQTADAAMELGIGICALLGGVYGAKAAKFLKDAKDRSKALKEIITGNELFKKTNQTQVESFKQAHASQSPQTRQIVTGMKT